MDRMFLQTTFLFVFATKNPLIKVIDSSLKSVIWLAQSVYRGRVLPALICCLIIRFPTEIYNNRAGYIVSDFKPLIDWETACYASGIKGRLGKYPSQIRDPIHRVAPYSTIAFNNPFRFSGLQPANNSHPNYPTRIR